MKKLTILLCTIISTIISSISYAAPNIWDEVSSLNEKFVHSQSFPILIFEKNILVPKLQGHNEEEQIEILNSYIQEKTGAELSHNELDQLLPYFTIQNDSALAQPFFDSQTGNRSFCAVLLSDNNNTLEQELKRTLGIAPNTNPYPNGTIQKLQNLYYLDELKRYSLYHELSHCLAPSYFDTLSMNESGIHQNESFAEGLALLFLYQNGIRKQGSKRALLRTYYSKYMGQYLATEDIPVMDEVVRKGGAIYYLAPILFAAEKYIDNDGQRIKNANTDELVQIAEHLVKANALSSRQLNAMYLYYSTDHQEILENYKSLAQEMPELMYDTYLFLLTLDQQFSTL